ncbi:MAG TPA: hypothetical protein VG604_03605 [Candidatus Saccharimonadales bacterium]|nr:hypothetical protein [Candidatus Saccharimonadales bacterium]
MINKLLFQFFADTQIGHGSLPTHASADSGTIQTIIQIAIQTVAGLSLLMIVISGFRYITAAGSEQKTAQAKSGIIYALVGLVVVIVAEAIVMFVGNSIK